MYIEQFLKNNRDPGLKPCYKSYCFIIFETDFINLKTCRSKTEVDE